LIFTTFDAKELRVRHPKAPKSIGILGGGQLARMMALEAHVMGIEPWVMSASKNDPAAQVTKFWIKGDPNKLSDLKKIFVHTNVATVESEFFDANTLKKINKKIFPQPQLLGLLQDRLSQKVLLQKMNVPTADFIAVSSHEDAATAASEFGYPFVIKKRRFGYDGYGTFVIRNQKDLHNLPREKYGYIAEAFVPFKRELAVSFVRSTSGEIVSLPLVETCQKNSICHWVMGPVAHPKSYPLLRALKNFVEETKYVGIIAFEIFDTGKELIVNEIAPRVHNSAHYSQDALNVSQFAYHLRAITGQPLPDPVPLNAGFAMVNLLGGGKKSVNWVTPQNGVLHWYGKNENRRGRKMGHINFLAKNPKLALKSALNAARNISI
jgi:5-(carboxyamino)imidazole ribonucleotide synthase